MQFSNAPICLSSLARYCFNEMKKRATVVVVVNVVVVVLLTFGNWRASNIKGRNERDKIRKER